MSDAWDDKRRAAEESYFAKKEAQALQGLKAHGATDLRKSPVTGEPMQPITIQGSPAFRCESSGGIWLEKGVLEAMLEKLSESSKAGQTSLLGGFLSDLLKRD